MASASPIDVYQSASAGSNSGSASPRQPITPKHVQFELLFPESPQYRARLPLRVQIYPHDDTESIISTVKNFYGLYHGGKGVSFEDDRRNTLIARYENFSNNMVVYVRVIEESPPPAGVFVPNNFQPAPIEYAGQQLGHHISRPTSRTSRRRSPSPNRGRGRRSASASTNPTAGKKGRSRSIKNRAANYDNHSDSLNGYSSGDGASASVSSKAKEQIGNTDISVENIVEGGRRKRAKFESSVSLPQTKHAEKHVEKGLGLTVFDYRNYHSLRRLRCQLRLLTRRSRLCVVLSTSDHLSHLRTLGKTPLQTLDPSNLPRATAMGTAKLACLRRQLATPDAIVAALVILAIVLVYYLPLTQLLEVVSLRRTKMSPSSL